jgi:IS5 family transposase
MLRIYFLTTCSISSKNSARRVSLLYRSNPVILPWAKLCALIEPYYPQQWFNLADPAAEEALYDSATLRQFAGIDLGAEPVPDETTVCKLRHLLNLHLHAKGVRISTGTIIDATLIHAPSGSLLRVERTSL